MKIQIIHPSLSIFSQIFETEYKQKYSHRSLKFISSCGSVTLLMDKEKEIILNP
jgi:hypothetical protein